MLEVVFAVAVDVFVAVVAVGFWETTVASHAFLRAAEREAGRVKLETSRMKLNEPPKGRIGRMKYKVFSHEMQLICL